MDLIGRDLERTPSAALFSRLRGWLWQLSIELEILAHEHGWGVGASSLASHMRHDRGRAVQGEAPLCRSLLAWVQFQRASSDDAERLLADHEDILSRLVAQLDDWDDHGYAVILELVGLLPSDDRQDQALARLVAR